ncbi:lipopolysaccharide biosynthesis protein [Selenomonas ruminantium]|nr:oligosaccharide flippase family protein [Selenomonas ruminantium]
MSIAVKASVWFLLCSIIQRSISFITTPIFTRLMTIEEYGLYIIYISWMEILSICITFKLTEAVFNKSMISVNSEERRSILASYQLLVLCLWGCSVFLYILFRNSINSLLGMNTYFMMLMLLEILLTTIVLLWSSYQRFEYKYKQLVFVTIIISVVSQLLGVLIITIRNDGAIGRVLGIVLTQMVVVIGLLPYNLKYIKRNIIFSNWIYALRFNLPLIPHYLSQIILSQADKIMIGALVGTQEAALYGIGYTIGMLGMIVTQSVNNAYIPWMYRELKRKNFNNVLSMDVIVFAFLGICIIVIFFIAPEAMLIVGGEKYLEAIDVVYPVAVSIAFMLLYGFFANIEYFFEKRMYVMVCTCTSAVLNIVLNYYFIQLYGYIAAAYTTLFCYFCYGFFHMIVVERVIYNNEKIKIKMPYIKFLILCVALAFFSLVAQFLIPYVVVRYLILFIMMLMLFAKKKVLLAFYKKIRSE